MNSFRDKKLNTSCKIQNVNGWNSVVSFAENRERSKSGMQRKPSSSEEFVEHSVLLSISILQPRAYDMHSQVIVRFHSRKSHHLNIFNVLVSDGRDSLLPVLINKVQFFVLPNGHFSIALLFLLLLQINVRVFLFVLAHLLVLLRSADPSEH